MSHPAGRSFPGDFHQSSGDRKDPSAGGGRDYHGAPGQCLDCCERPGLLWPLQGRSAPRQRCYVQGHTRAVKSVAVRHVNNITAVVVVVVIFSTLKSGSTIVRHH